MREAEAHREAMARLDDLVARLNGPLTTEMQADWWTDEIRVELLAWAEGARRKLEHGETLTSSDVPSGMARSLDGAGVTSGELLDFTLGALIALRRVLEGPPPRRSLPARAVTEVATRVKVAQLKRLVARSRRNLP